MNKEKIIRLLETPPVTGRTKDYAGMVDFAKLADMIDQLYQLDLEELQEDLRLARNGYSELKTENIELKGEVKAGAGMLADMHNKFETVSQAVGVEWERFAQFLLDHYKGMLERGDNNSISVFAMILNFGDRYNLPGLKRRADKIREELRGK